MWNEHAKIRFTCPLSVLGENIDEEIILEHQFVSVHPNGNVGPGERLNQPSVITLFNFFDENARLAPEKVLQNKAMNFIGCKPND